MDDVRMVVDHRERALLEVFREGPAREALDVGDCCFYVGEELALAVERKTLPDLAASIKDGRYREQKQRLLGAVGRDRVLYVVEGVLPWTASSSSPSPDRIHGIKRATLLSCIANMTVRDGVRVVRTGGVGETAAFLENVAARAAAAPDPRAYFLGAASSPHCPTVMQRKSDNHTPEVTFLHQLAAVPGVSLKTAGAIRASGIASMRQLCAEATEAALADVRLSKRRLGGALARRILEHCGGGPHIEAPPDAGVP
jgi:ERCC4-type nuclease